MEEARTRFPSWSKIPLAAAQVADLRGNGDGALESYRAAFDLGERSPVVVNRMLSLLVDRQENEKIEAVVRQLIDEKVPFSSELTSVVSQALVQMGDRQGALALARKSAATSKDSRNVILLGQLLRVNGRPDEAEAEFQPSDPVGAERSLALVCPDRVLFLGRKKRDLASKTLRQALASVDPQQAWEVKGLRVPTGRKAAGSRGDVRSRPEGEPQTVSDPQAGRRNEIAKSPHGRRPSRSAAANI